MSRRSNLLQGLFITLAIFLFIGAMKLITFRSHFFDPFNKSIKDYEVTDIVFSQFRDPEKVEREPRIMMIHVEAPERAQIARAISKIAIHEPKVIGVDILFSGKKDSIGDALLSNALSNAPNVVLAANLEAFDEGLKKIPGTIVSDDLFSSQTTNAYTNFLAGKDRTVRMFTPELTTATGKKEQAFALAIANKFDPTAISYLQNRAKKAERINYKGDYRSFLRLDINTLLEMPSEALGMVRDRIILIGYANSEAVNAPLEDRYYTPLNPVYTGRSIPDMYGMVIHANIISMILDRRYIYELPAWITWIFVLLFSLVNVMVIHRLYHKLPSYFHGITRLLQLFEFLICFFIVAFLFYQFRIRIDFSLGFLALVLAYDIVMIYESLIRKKIPFLKNL